MIVLIEDNITNQRVLTKRLSSITEEEVKSFTNGADATVFIKTQKAHISCVIIDGNLAKAFLDKEVINGPEVAKMILEINSHIPLITWTDDQSKLQEFTHLFHMKSKPYFKLSKPLEKTNLEAMLDFVKAEWKKPQLEVTEAEPTISAIISA